MYCILYVWNSHRIIFSATSMSCIQPSTTDGGIVMLCASLNIFFTYFWEDLVYFLRWKQVKATVKKLISNGIDLFKQRVGKILHKPFLTCGEKVHTYQDVDRRSDRAAQVFWENSDTVTLPIVNGIDFNCVSFGRDKLGCVTAFLSFNMHSRSLLLCINVHTEKVLVIGEGKFCIVIDLILTFNCFMLSIKSRQGHLKLQTLHIYIYIHSI